MGTMRVRYGLLFGLIAILILSLASCQPPRISSNRLPDKVYARVVSLSPSTTELVGSLRAEALLVGRTARCNLPASIRNVEIVANPEPDFEKLMSLQPDLVVVDRAVLNPRWEEQIQRLGADLFVVQSNSIEEWKRSVYELGARLMRHYQAARLVDLVEQAIRVWQQDPLDPKPRVLVAFGPRQPWVAGLRTFQADLIRACGADPVGQEGDRFETVSPEQILAWDPDVIIVPGDPNEFTGVPWDSTTAGKHNAILGVDPDVLLRAGGQVDRAIEATGTEIRKRVRQGK